MTITGGPAALPAHWGYILRMNKRISGYIALFVITVLFGVQTSIARDTMSQSHDSQDPKKVMAGLREKILDLSPKEINVSPSNEYPHVWGILMETGFPNGVATLVSLADGTVSLYLSSGGGVIGGGEHVNVKKAARSFLQSAEHYRKEFTSTKSYPLPNVGRVRFYILTYSGIYTNDIEEEILGKNMHILSPLFYAGHGVLTELRKISEK